MTASTRPTQAKKVAELITPLGKDKLVLSSFTASEELGRPFEIRIDCLSEDPEIDFNAVIGKNCNIRLLTPSGQVRYYSGVAVEAGWAGEKDFYYSYSLVLRPWLWLLTQTADCKIFQHKSVTEVIKKVFSDAGFNDFEDKTTENYKTQEYIVQYRESSFNFVCRLMEAHGIYYYFKHTNSKHILVMADGKGSHEKIPGLETILFGGRAEDMHHEEEYLTSWNTTRSFRTGKVRVTAFDFNRPTADLAAEHTSGGGYGNDKLEYYDYPEKYKDGEESSIGLRHAKSRLFAAQSFDRRRHASGNAPSLCPGGLTTVRRLVHPKGDNREYLVVACSHSFIAQHFRSSARATAGDQYRGSYVLQQSDRPFKMPTVTPHPVVHGPQTATVVGPSGEEIYTDKHGRVKIQFHWDRHGKRDEGSSRWARVAQIWAGKKWGGLFLPRIGMEVIVEFLEGDPDRPVIVGCVFNADNPPHFDLPAKKTFSGIMSRSTKGGSSDNYNHWYFNDEKGEERFVQHAEKDFYTTVEDFEQRVVLGKNRKGPGETTRDTTITKGDDVRLVANGDCKTEISRHQELKIKGNQTIETDGDMKEHVHKTMTMEADQQIVLKVGGSTITITPMSIEIKSSSITIKSDLMTKIEGGMAIEEKAAIIKLN